MDSNGHNGIKGLRVLLSGPAADGVATMLAHQPAISLVRPTGLAETQASADVALHVLESSSVHGELPHARELRVPLILAAYGEPNGIVETGLAVGAADVLVLPQPAETLVFALRKAAAAAVSANGYRGKVVTVFSPKGGSGKTVLATNLAAATARSGVETLLIDLDLQFGDSALTLAVSPRATIADLAASAGDIDLEKLKAFVSTDSRTGLSLLPSPKRPEEADLVGAPQLAAMLEAARGGFGAVVIDTGPLFDAPMLAALDHSEQLLLVCNPEVTSLKNVRIGLETIDRLGFPRERVSLVANRIGAAGAVARDDIEDALDTKIAFELPDDPEVPAAINRALPVVLANEGASFSQAAGRLADTVFAGARAEDDAPAAPLRAEGTSMSASTSTAASPRNDASVLAERLQVDRAQARARARDPHAELKTRIHRACIAKLGAAFLNLEGADELERRVQEIVSEELKGEEVPLSPSERALLERQIGDDILGYGPLEPFLRDPSVTEIMVNGYDQLYIERGGVIQETDASFLDDAHVLRIIDRIVSQVGRRIDESSPMVDARLPDGSRVNAIIPPLALRGPSLTIRKFAQDALTLESLVELGTMTPQTADFLAQCVRGKLNILISGGTGTGKTTLLNAVSQFVPAGERIVTVEDAAELRLQQRHVVPLESRPPNVEGEGEVRIRDLVRNALRMRPDRIIVGEVRGAEALDMLQAMNTGHDGSLTTIHANSARDALHRLEMLVLMAGVELPVKAIREQIAGGFDLLVHIARLVDGSRRVTQITEIAGMEGDVVTLQDLFVARRPAKRGPAANRVCSGRSRPPGCGPEFLAQVDGERRRAAASIWLGHA